MKVEEIETNTVFVCEQSFQHTTILFIHVINSD
jgi:hypothetical protein